MPLDPALRALMKAAAVDAPKSFVEDRILAGAPRACASDPGTYDSLKQEVAAKLSISPVAIQLIGSAHLGFSLNPDHLLRPFMPDSDLDLVVVSPQLFDEAMLELSASAKDIQMAGQDEKSRL